MNPVTAWINIISACNNRCVWCYAKDAKITSKTMPYSQAEATLKRLISIGCKKCVLIGGEPTLHPQITMIFADAKKMGLNVKIVSNGRRFANTNFCQEMIDAGLKTKDVTLSMHASSINDSFVLTGSTEYFNEFKLGLNNLLNLGVVPYINITISRPLFDQTENMMRWIATQKLPSIAFNLGAPAVSQGGIDAESILPPDILARKAFELFQQGKNIGIRTGFLFNVPLCLLSKKELESLVRDDAIVSGCQILSGKGILFNVDGDLVTCNHLLDFKVCNRKEIENIIDTGRFLQFWSSDKMQKIRNSACVYRSKHCQTCDFWDICGGGCPIFWSYYNPQQFIPGWDKGGE